jgi:hypothetical protein
MEQRLGTRQLGVKEAMYAHTIRRTNDLRWMDAGGKVQLNNNKQELTLCNLSSTVILPVVVSSANNLCTKLVLWLSCGSGVPNSQGSPLQVLKIRSRHLFLCAWKAASVDRRFFSNCFLTLPQFSLRNTFTVQKKT